MSALYARRQRQSPPPNRRVSQPMSKDYDSRSQVDDALEEMLPGQELVSRLADVDDADGSAQPFELAGGVDVLDEDVSVPVIPKRANEFICSSCFLIRHISCLASREGGRLICADCG